MGQRILGLDIGAASVKAVVVETAHRAWTVAASGRAAVPAQASVPPGAEPPPTLRERQRQAVRELLADGRLAFDSAVVALPGASATHLVALPFTDARRIQQTVGFEVESQIPFDLAEVAWDWQPLLSSEGKTELLVAVVKKDELSGLLADLAEAGVDPRAVVPPGPCYSALFAGGALAGEGSAPAGVSGVEEAAAASPAGLAEAGAQGFLDVGSTRTSLCLVSGGACVAARTFPVGSAAPASAIAREVRATIRAWRARCGPSAAPLRRLVLAGDAARVPGLFEALGPEVEGPVEPVALATPAAGAIDAEEAPGMALALALALRGLQGPRAGRLNLRRGDLAYTRDFEHLRGKVARLGVWAALVILLAMVSSGVKVFALSRQERLLDAALCDATQKLVGKCYVNDELAVAALRGKGTAAGSIPRNSAVDIFTELSVRAPQDVPLRFDRMEITRDKLHLQGTTDAAENVDKIVSALRASRCFGDARSGGARKRASDGKFEFTIDSDLTCDTGEKPVVRG